MAESRRTGDRLSHRCPVPIALLSPGAGLTAGEQGVGEPLVDAGTDLDPVGTSLTTKVSAPFVRVLDIRERNDDVPTREELAVGVTALHSLDKLFNPLEDFDRILQSGTNGTKLSTSESEEVDGVHKDRPWALPAQRLVESIWPETQLEALLVGMTGDATPGLGERLGVAVRAAGRHLCRNQSPGSRSPQSTRLRCCRPSCSWSSIHGS